ncbi:MAG: YcaO-like family protein [Alphaproteobacteria bacterium]|nr:YcaO-like family protein [Alphaproteobacteria bacterium]
MQITDMTAELLAGVRGFAPPGAAVGADALQAAFAPHLAHAFRLSAPDAPGLHFVGAQLDVAGLGPISVGGTGLDDAAAIAGCLGEAFERLSQVDDGTVALRRGDAPAGPAVLVRWWRDHGRGAAASPPLDWFAGHDLASGAAVEIPADLCLRRPADRQQMVADFPLSTGCAAGRSLAAAREAAALELIERDAASLWWIGGTPAAALPAAAAASAAAMIAALRGHAAGRRTWLLDITSDLAVPCVAALSTDPDGRGLACGLAARLDAGEAARAALLELGQMELALRLTRAKEAARGREALNAVERGQLDRARAIDAAACALLHPQRPAAADGADTRARSLPLPGAVPLLSNLAGGTFGFDLTHPRFGVAVARLVAPGLQLLPCGHRSERLIAAAARYGDNAALVRNLPLM